jgi:hypothetical protein
MRKRGPNIPGVSLCRSQETLRSATSAVQVKAATMLRVSLAGGAAVSAGEVGALRS